MRAGEICLAHFPLGDAPGMKLRPVLLLSGPLGPVPEILVAYISSVMPKTRLPSDIVLDPGLRQHKPTNLKMVSVVRLHKLATIHASSVARELGEVSPAVLADARSKLRALLGL